MKRAIYILLFSVALLGYSFPVDAQSRGGGLRSGGGGSIRSGSGVGAMHPGGGATPSIQSRGFGERSFVNGQNRIRGGYGGRYYGRGGGGYYGHGGGYYRGGSHSHFSGGIFLGGPWWWGGYPYSYPYSYYTAPSPVIVEQGPREYIYQEAQPDENYWYFCKDPEGYYPYVKRCPDGWLKVVPSPSPQDRED